MAANGRGNMRPAGRSPPFLAIGLFVALVILGFNYWSLSARNGEQANEISLMESELRLVNAKKTSAEKRSEVISEKITDLEKQLNEQKETIARNQAELADVEREKRTFIERTSELENEVKDIRDQQLPSCETDKTNLQKEVEQLRADIELHKNKECDRSACEQFTLKERDATVEDVYKVVGALPLISMYRSNVNLGSYRDQIASLAAKMDKDTLAKQQQGVGQQQQQQQPSDTLQQQQQPADTQQQQQQPVGTIQQQSIDTQQQQQPADTLQQQQQQPADIAQVQQPGDTLQQQQQQQQPVDTAQQQQSVDTLPQLQPAVQQQQTQYGQQQQPYGQLQPQQDGQLAAQDPRLASETGLDRSNMNPEDNMKAADADAVLRQDGLDVRANMTKTAVVEQEQKPDVNMTTNKTTAATTLRPGGMIDSPLRAPNVTLTTNATTTNNKPADQEN